MRREEMIAELERLARMLGVEVRYERMGILSGGLCRLGNSLVLFVNKLLPLRAKIEVMASELKSLSWDKHFVKPEVRQRLEEK